MNKEKNAVHIDEEELSNVAGGDGLPVFMFEEKAESEGRNVWVGIESMGFKARNGDCAICRECHSRGNISCMRKENSSSGKFTYFYDCKCYSCGAIYDGITYAKTAPALWFFNAL